MTSLNKQKRKKTLLILILNIFSLLYFYYFMKKIFVLLIPTKVQQVFCIYTRSSFQNDRNKVGKVKYKPSSYISSYNKNVG